MGCGHDHRTSTPSKIVLEGDVMATVEFSEGTSKYATTSPSNSYSTMAMEEIVGYYMERS